jgi:Fic family protein
MAKYIYQYKNWTQFTWDESRISALLGEVRNLQGKIAGKMSILGFSERDEASLTSLTIDVVKSSEIEGEILNYDQVRSSIANKLGINIGGLKTTDRNVEGVVEMMLDATQNYHKQLSHDRLFGWNAALFPTGYSGMHKLEVGQYRTGEMQIVSGPIGKEKVHYVAIEPKKLVKEMSTFLDWINGNVNLDPVLKAAVAHFWFIIIHPFDDGNGRIARAITDLLLSRAENSPERFYSMSSQLMIQKKEYYAILQKVQRSDGDITDWIEWFFLCLKNALIHAENGMEKILSKSKFWKIHEGNIFNPRQRIVINKLLDGFEGKMRTSKWATLAKCSSDTALRDIKDLLDMGVFVQEDSGGRSTSYSLVPF